MIFISTKNNFIFEKYLLEAQKSVKSFQKKYDLGEIGFVDVDKTVNLEEIEKFVGEKKDLYDFVVVLGIGGSALGTKAVLEALKGKYYNDLYNPKIFVCDNVDPYEISDILNAINLERTLFLTISKSGSTLETLSTYEFFKGKILKENLEIKNHFVCITGENSKLHKDALKNEINCFFLDENIGGRFSVLTNVGLLPLAFCGINIKKLFDGFLKVKTNFLENDISKNIALQSALLQFDCYKKGKDLTVFFPYLSNFKNFGAWYKQLFGESLGKNNIGANIFTSIGTTDQHSDLQLFSDGKDDKLFIFLELEKFEKDLNVFGDEKITFGNILNLEKYGTQKALEDKGKDCYTIKIEKLNEENLGILILFLEFQVAYLGELLEINAYNQPGVEGSKKITKEKIIQNFPNSKLLL